MHQQNKRGRLSHSRSGSMQVTDHMVQRFQHEKQLCDRNGEDTVIGTANISAAQQHWLIPHWMLPLTVYLQVRVACGFDKCNFLFVLSSRIVTDMARSDDRYVTNLFIFFSLSLLAQSFNFPLFGERIKAYNHLVGGCCKRKNDLPAYSESAILFSLRHRARRSSCEETPLHCPVMVLTMMHKPSRRLPWARLPWSGSTNVFWRADGTKRWQQWPRY